MNAYRAIDQPGQVVKSTPLASIHCPKALRLESGRLYSLKHEKRAVERSYGQINAPSCDRLASQDDPTVSVFPSDGDGANSKSFGAVSMQLSTGSRRAFYDIQLREALEQPKSRRRGITECRGSAHFRPRWPLGSLYRRGPSPGQLANDDLFVSLSLQCSYW